MGDMDWGDTERGGHLKKFFIKMLVFVLVIGIAIVAVVFLRPKKDYYDVGVSGETYCIPHLTGDGKYESGKRITISADDIPGYVFRNWTLNGDIVSTEAEYTFVVKEETAGVYIANYDAIDYSVRGYQIYGRFTIKPSANVGDLIEIKDITPNEGYEAKRAYYTTDSSDEEIPIFDYKFNMPASDIKVFVEFSPIVYSVEYELDGGEFSEEVEVVTSYTLKTQSFTLPTPTKEGYDFLGWTGTDLSRITPTVTVTRGSIGNRTYTANYDFHTYSITNISSQNGSITVASSAKYKSTVGITVNAGSGFGLSELYYILAGTSTKVPIIDNAFEMPAGNVYIYSTFSKVGYTIKLGSITHGSVDIDRTSAYLGESVSIRVQADTAYRFSRSYYVVDGSVEQREFSGSFYMPGGNVTVVVEFTPEVYSIKLNLNGGKLNGVSYEETYEYTKYTIESNRIVLPTPDEREGYDFLGWSGTDILPEGSYVLSYVIPKGSSGERTYSANWKLRTYRIIFNNYDGSQLLVLPAVEHGTKPEFPGTPTKPSTPEYDYIFKGWTPALVVATEEATYTAEFTQTLHEYTVTFDSCGGESVSPYIRHYNDNIGTMPTPTRKGYSLDGWFTRAEGGAQMIASDKVTADVTYYAHWSLVNYTVEIELDGGTFTGETSFTYNVTSSDITLARPSKTGYTFVGYTGTDLSEKTLDVTIPQGSTGNRVYLANWEAIKYTIKWLNYDGSTLLEEQVAYDTMPEYSGDRPTKPQDAEFSYVFNNVWQPAVTKVTGNASYTAQFEAVTNGYTFTFDSRGGSDVHEITKDYNKEIGTLPVPTFDGYTFDGWYTEVTGGDKLTETTKVTENRTYYAHWNVVTYTITYDLDGGTGTGVNSYTVETETFTLFTPTKTGYAFVGWTGTDLTSATVDVVIAKGSIGNRSYTANWSQSAFSITKGSVTNGTIDAPADAYMGATVTITASPAEGYEVSNYYYIESGSTEKKPATNGSFTMPANSVTVYAEFIKSTYIITIADTANGEVSANKTSATMGEEITITTTPDNGYFANSISYRLAGSDTDTVINNSKFTMPAGNVTIYVVFGYRNYTITKGTIANGSLTVPASAKYKDEVTVTATPVESYELTALYYYLDGDNTNKITITDNKFTMPASNITIYAEFTAKTRVTLNIGNITKTYPCSKGATLASILPEEYNEHNTSGYYTEDENGERTYYDSSYVINSDITLYTHLATLSCLKFTADDATNPTSYFVERALYSADNTITSVVIPKLYNNLPVKYVKDMPRSTNLASIEIPNTIEIFAPHFERFKGPTIYLPEGLKGLGTLGNISYSLAITEMTIPSTVTQIGKVSSLNENFDTFNDYGNAFTGLENLDTIKIRNGNTHYKIVNNCLLTIDGTELISGTKQSTIPSGIKMIVGQAFYKINPNSPISLQEGLEEIDEFAFYGSKLGGLKEIVFPSTLKIINTYAFSPSGLSGTIEKITLNEGVKLCSNAFNGALIQEINIPKGCEIIGNPFVYCNRLQHITVSSENTIHKVVNECLLSIDGKDLFFGCKNSVIPDGVENIRGDAFSNVEFVNTQIILPDSVTKINTNGFSSSNITSVYLSSSLTSIGDNAFSTLVSVKNLKTIYINNTYCYTNAIGTEYDNLGGVLKYPTKVYVLATVDKGSNTYLSNTTNYPYKYTGISYNGKVYNLYSKNVLDQQVTMYVDGVERTFSGAKGQALSTFLPEELNEHNTSGYYAEDENGERTYYDASFVINSDITLHTHKATLSYLKFTPDDATNPTSYMVQSSSWTANNTITSVVVPKLYNNLPVKHVGKMPSSRNLASLEIPNTVEIFAPVLDYFKGTTIYLPEGIKKLGDIFNYLASHQTITHITIPSTVTGIAKVNSYGETTLSTWESNPFARMSGLETITVREGNTAYKVVNNCLLSIDGTELISGAKQSIIPNTVKTIGIYAFYGISPNSPISLPDGLEVIENGAFGNSNLGGLTEIVFPNSLKRIETYAFLWVVSLTKITLNEGVTLGGSAFRGINIKEVNIPKGCIIDSNPFNDCKVLEHITVSSENTEYKVINECLLTIDGKKLIFGCKKSTIPDGIETIGFGAFLEIDLENTQIVLPESTKVIDLDSFMDSNITSIYLPASITEIANAFTGTEKLSTVYINNTYCYSNAVGTEYNNIGGALKNATQVYVLASVDDGSNTYLSNTTNYPYKYTGVNYNGKVYNLYSKEDVAVAITLTVDGTEHTYNGIKGLTLASAIPEEYNEHNTSGYYVKDADGERTYYDASHVITAPMSLNTHLATLSCLKFTPDDSENPTSYKVQRSSGANMTITSVVVPKLYNNLQVKSVGQMPNSTKLASIEIPNSVEVFAPQFENFNGKTIYLPEGLKTIKTLKNGRYNSSSVLITNITIPSTVTILTDDDSSYNPFGGLKNLNTINVRTGNIAFKVVDGCLLSIDGTKLISGTKQSVIPNTVKNIMGDAFYLIDPQTPVSLHEGLESIETRAFAFTGLGGLKEVEFPSTLKKIGLDAFNQDISSSISKITKITLNEGVKIYSGAFEGTKISEVNIPKGCEIVTGTLAYFSSPFAKCSLLEHFTVNAENTYLKTVNDCLLTKDGKILISGCKNSSIPSGVVSIVAVAFSYVEFINKDIVIPDTATTIYGSAFYRAAYNSIYLSSALESCSASAFFSPYEKTVYINNTYAYTQAKSASELALGGALNRATKVYVLASVDNGSNTYLSNTTNYPYKYTGMIYNGKTYNVYSKEQAYGVSVARNNGGGGITGLQDYYFTSDTVQFKTTFREYYELSNISLLNNSSTLTKVSENNYKFVMGSQDCVIILNSKKQASASGVYFVTTKLSDNADMSTVVTNDSMWDWGYKYDASDTSGYIGFRCKSGYTLTKCDVYNGNTKIKTLTAIKFENRDDWFAFEWSANVAYDMILILYYTKS